MWLDHLLSREQAIEILCVALTPKFQRLPKVCEAFAQQTDEVWWANAEAVLSNLNNYRQPKVEADEDVYL